MAHIQDIDDENGELVDRNYYCSDWCHSFDPDYAGWDGCNEIYSPEICKRCERSLSYYDEESEKFISRED